MGPTKLNRRLIDAWLGSALARDRQCILVFVGDHHQGDYGSEALDAIRRSGLDKRIRITGWADVPMFRRYLAAADVAVQLRTHSRGETSGTALDCMNYGVPTIVNANGSLADLPSDAVWMLPDEFRDAELIGALETLWLERTRREEIGAQGRKLVLSRHAPRACADQYAEAIETMYRHAATDQTSLAKSLGEAEPPETEPLAWERLADAVAKSLPPGYRQPQLLIDVSGLDDTADRSDVERSVGGLLKALIVGPPERFRVEPVDVRAAGGYRYARASTLRLMDCPDTLLDDSPIELFSGDLFLCLNLEPQAVAARRCVYDEMRNAGVRVWFMVHDLPPALRSEALADCPVGAHESWLAAVAAADGAVCISETLSAELSAWLERHSGGRQRPVGVRWFQLGADRTEVPSKDMASPTWADSARLLLAAISPPGEIPPVR
jgi:hypothetical protein